MSYKAVGVSVDNLIGFNQIGDLGQIDFPMWRFMWLITG